MLSVYQMLCRLSDSKMTHIMIIIMRFISSISKIYYIDVFFFFLVEIVITEASLCCIIIIMDILDMTISPLFFLLQEKFKDIVDWLKANVAKSASIPTSSAISDQKITVDVPENYNTTTQAATNNGFVKETPFTSFSNPQSSGFLSTSKSSGLFSFSQPPAPTGTILSVALSACT